MNPGSHLRFAAILLVAVIFCSGAAAAMSVIAGTQPAADARYPVCTAPCVCMSESDAAEQWGAEGYEMCSKTICGQTADAMIQFYCIHPKGAATAREAVTTTAAGTAATTVQAPGSPATTAPPVVVTTPVTTPAGIPTKSAASGFLVVLAVAGTVIIAAAVKRD